MTRSTARILSLSALLFLSVACKPDYPKCKSDDHCSERGEICVEELCRECATDDQCKTGYTCQHYACVPLPECRGDDDCQDGMSCRNQKCVPECTGDAQCAEGQRCQNNRCVARAAACTDDSQCAEGESCQDGFCLETAPDLFGEGGSEGSQAAALKNCTLETIFFGFNDYALTTEAREALERNAACIRFQNKAVLIAGHADERGTEEYNLVLGERRANATRRHLTGLGVRDNLLRTVSYGEERPLDPGQNEQAWSRNRRAEFSFR